MSKRRPISKNHEESARLRKTMAIGNSGFFEIGRDFEPAFVNHKYTRKFGGQMCALSGSN